MIAASASGEGFMKVLRKILGVIVLLLAIVFAASAAAWAMHKHGDMPAVAQLEPHLAAVNDAAWWLVAVCAAAALFFLISALSLLRNTRQAFTPYLAAFVATGVLWWFVCQAPKHGLSFAVAGRECEIAWWAGLVVLGVLVWLSDRRKRYRPDAE
jgi:hypothetical protein